MYVRGVDAGGTKTHCAVADHTGRILGEGFSGPGNHQTCGLARTKYSLQQAVDQALERAEIRRKDLAFAVFGMSGADGEDDFAVLNPLVKEVMGGIRFEVMHDGWIGFRSAVDSDAGVVSICGTGAGHSGKNGRGEELTLRNLDYLTGNTGGGSELAEKAMHYAFRSEEGTWEKSALEESVPELFGMETMEEVCGILKNGGLPAAQAAQLPKLVFRLAEEGDSVCRMLISKMGEEEGHYAAAIIRRLHMETETVPVVLIGSLFHTKNPLLVEPYKKEVIKTAPNAYLVIPDAAPVTGAVRVALERLEQK